MRLIVFILLFKLIFILNLFSTDYYICLGSFVEYSNAKNYADLLNRYGICTTFENVNINNSNFTRVLYHKKYFDLESPRYEMKLLLRNPIFKALKITNFWIKSDNNNFIE